MKCSICIFVEICRLQQQSTSVAAAQNIVNILNIVNISLWNIPTVFLWKFCRLQQRSTSVAAAQTTTPCTWTTRNINHLGLPSLVLFWFFCNSHLNWIDWESNCQLKFFLLDINFDYCIGGRRVWRIWTNDLFHPSKISEEQLNCRAEELFQTIYRSL